MQLDAGLDTGPMLRAARRCDRPRDTSAELHARLAERGARLLLQVIGGARGRHALRASAARAGRQLRAEAREARGPDRLAAPARARLPGRCAPAIPGRWRRPCCAANRCRIWQAPARCAAACGAALQRPGACWGFEDGAAGGLRRGAAGDRAAAVRRPAGRQRRGFRPQPGASPGCASGERHALTRPALPARRAPGTAAAVLHGAASVVSAVLAEGANADEALARASATRRSARRSTRWRWARCAGTCDWRRRCCRCWPDPRRRPTRAARAAGRRRASARVLARTRRRPRWPRRSTPRGCWV